MASGSPSCLSWPSFLILLPGTCWVPRPPRTYDPNHPRELGRGVRCLPTAGSAPSEPRQRCLAPCHCVPAALCQPSWVPCTHLCWSPGPPALPREMTHSHRMQRSSQPFSVFSSLAASASTSQALTEPLSGNLLIFSPHWSQGRPQGPASAPLGTHSQQFSHHKS